MLNFHVFRQIRFPHSLSTNRTMNFRLMDITDVFVEVTTLLAAIRTRDSRNFPVPIILRGFLFRSIRRIRWVFDRIIVFVVFTSYTAADAAATAGGGVVVLVFAVVESVVVVILGNRGSGWGLRSIVQEVRKKMYSGWLNNRRKRWPRGYTEVNDLNGLLQLLWRRQLLTALDLDDPARISVVMLNLQKLKLAGT